MAAKHVVAPCVEGDQLRSPVLAIYTERYGLPHDDPLVSRELASITV